jgi:hypothetical protein
MAVAESAFSVCANCGLLAVFKVTIPHRHLKQKHNAQRRSKQISKTDRCLKQINIEGREMSNQMI